MAAVGDDATTIMSGRARPMVSSSCPHLPSAPRAGAARAERPVEESEEEGEGRRAERGRGDPDIAKSPRDLKRYR